MRLSFILQEFIIIRPKNQQRPQNSEDGENSTSEPSEPLRGIRAYLDPLFSMSIIVEDNPSLGPQFFNMEFNPVENVVIETLQKELEWNRVSPYNLYSTAEQLAILTSCLNNGIKFLNIYNII